MAVQTNFDPLNVGGSGLAIASGTARHDVILAITAALVSTGHFTEVTTSAPTHTQLRPYGSTGVSASGTAVTSPGTPRHVTLRFTSDALATSGYGKLIRFWPCNAGVQITVLDTNTASNPGTNALEWLLCYTQGDRVDLTTEGKTDIYDAIEDLGLNNATFDDVDNTPIGNAGATGSILTNATTWTTNMRIYYWCDSDWLYLHTHRDSDQQNFGNFFCFSPGEPIDAHWLRAERPTIYVIELNTSFDDTGDDDSLWRGHIGSPGTSTLEPNVDFNSFKSELVEESNLKSPNNEEYLQRVVGNIETGGQHAFLGIIPGLYLMRYGSGVSRFDELTVDGQNYHVVHNHGVNWAFLVDGGAA